MGMELDWNEPEISCKCDNDQCKNTIRNLDESNCYVLCRDCWVQISFGEEAITIEEVKEVINSQDYKEYTSNIKVDLLMYNNLPSLEKEYERLLRIKDNTEKLLELLDEKLEKYL